MPLDGPDLPANGEGSSLEDPSHPCISRGCQLTVTVPESLDAPCDENHVMPSRTRSYCRQYVPGDAGATTVTGRALTLAAGPTSAAKLLRTPSNTAALDPGQAPLR